MKRIILVACTALSIGLGGCANTVSSSLPPAPAIVAEQTVLDEQALLAAEASYKAAREIMEAAVDRELVTPAVAARFRAINIRANDVLVKARAAYDAANASSFAAAIAEAGPLINQLWQLTTVKGGVNASRP